MKITVIGNALPQGSKSARVIKGRAILTEGFGEGPRRRKEWRAAVAEEARRWLERNGMPPPLDCPLKLILNFYLPKPVSLSKKVTEATKKPDLSKLIRSVEDSLSKIVYVDDARIVSIEATKAYALDSPPRVEIEVRQI